MSSSPSSVLALRAEPSTSRPHYKGFLFVVPALLLIVVFQLGAAIFNLVMSGTNWSLAGAQFIGLGNYTELLRSHEFLNSLLVTMMYVIGTVPVAIVLAFPIAYVLHFKLARFAVYRVIIFLPYVVPTVATALVFSIIFGSTPAGLANWALSKVGIADQRWLVEPNGIINVMFGTHLSTPWSGPSLALTVVMLAQIWNLIGFAVIVLMSGMTNLPQEYIEAARIDGASEGRIGRSIILPQLAPTVLFLGVAMTVFAVREFNLVYLLTGGGPNNTSETLTIMMVREFYENNRLGYGSTVGIILAIGVSAFSYLQFRIARRQS